MAGRLPTVMASKSKSDPRVRNIRIKTGVVKRWDKAYLSSFNALGYAITFSVVGTCDAYVTYLTRVVHSAKL